LNTVPKPPVVSTPQATTTLNRVTSQQDTLIAKNLEQEKAPSYVPPVIIGSQEPIQPVNLFDGSGKPLLKDDSSILDVPKPPIKNTAIEIESTAEGRQFKSHTDLENSFFGKNFDTDSITQGFNSLNENINTLDSETVSAALDKINDGFSVKKPGAFLGSSDELEHLKEMNRELENLSSNTTDPLIKEKISNTQSILTNVRKKWER